MNITIPHISSYLCLNPKFTINDVASKKIGIGDAPINFNGIKILVASKNLKGIAQFNFGEIKSQIECLKKEKYF